MHIMQELPTIKTNFLFENSQDFNQTTHGRPQYSIFFIHNISLYFKCISSVKYVFKWSCHSHIMPFSAVQPKRFNVFTPKICLHLVWKAEKVLKCSFKCGIFYSFHIPKWPVTKWIGSEQICKYFLFSIIFQSF